MKKKYRVAADLNDLKKALKYLEDQDHDFVSFDIETNSVVEKTARVIGIGFTCWNDEAWYIPLAEWDGEKLEDTMDPGMEKEFIEELCEILLKKKLIMHNGVFDIACIYHSYGIDLTEALYCDTILLKHTVDEERPFGLKDLAIRYQRKIGIPDSEIANQEQIELKESVIAQGGKWNAKNKEMYLAPADIIGKYCCADVDLTLRIFEYLERRLEREGLMEFFYDWEVMPLYRKATIPMKLRGLYIDVNYFKKLEKESECDIIKLESEVFNEIQGDIEPKVKEILDKAVKTTRSGRFAERVLRYYNLPVPINGKTGKPTLAKSKLQSLKADFPDHIALEWLTYESEYLACPLEWIEEHIDVLSDDEGNVDEVFVPPHWKNTRPKRVYEMDPGEPSLSEDVVYEIKKEIYVEQKPDLPNVFNLSSTQHLAWLLYDLYGQEPSSYSRQTNAPQVDKNSLEKFDLPFIPNLAKLKKEEKVLSTYIKPILEKHIEGWIYPSMLQFGTTSGRYSCAGGLNLQTLPRDDVRIKKGFIAPPGYKVVNADFSSLEPRIFAWVSKDPGLKEVYFNNLDLYSKIAIDVFGLDSEKYSAVEFLEDGSENPKFLKTVDKSIRDKVKIFTLAVVYGANAFRIAQLMKVSVEEAQDTITKYLDSYPYLKDYMENQDITARVEGRVWTEFGRIRHLPEARRLYGEFGEALNNKMAMALYYAGDEGRMLHEQMQRLHRSKKQENKERARKLREEILKLGREGVDTYYRFRNYMNNAKNFPIQSTAAHVTNAALIKLSDRFKEERIDGWISLQVHDEICTYIKDEEVDKGAAILQDAMENNVVTAEIDIPMFAVPVIAVNFAEAK